MSNKLEQAIENKDARGSFEAKLEKWISDWFPEVNARAIALEIGGQVEKDKNISVNVDVEAEYWDKVYNDLEKFAAEMFEGYGNDYTLVVSPEEYKYNTVKDFNKTCGPITITEAVNNILGCGMRIPFSDQKPLRGRPIGYWDNGDIIYLDKYSDEVVTHFMDKANKGDWKWAKLILTNADRHMEMSDRIAAAVKEADEMNNRVNNEKKEHNEALSQIRTLANKKKTNIERAAEDVRTMKKMCEIELTQMEYKELTKLCNNNIIQPYIENKIVTINLLAAEYITYWLGWNGMYKITEKGDKAMRAYEAKKKEYKAPPGIVELHNGHDPLNVQEVLKNCQGLITCNIYDKLVGFHLTIEPVSTIHTIEENGVQWSVGEKTDRGVIKELYFNEHHQKWMAHFQYEKGSCSCIVELLKKYLFQLPDAEGEMLDIFKGDRVWFIDKAGSVNFHTTCGNPLTKDRVYYATRPAAYKAKEEKLKKDKFENEKVYSRKEVLQFILDNSCDDYVRNVNEHYAKTALGLK